MDRLLTMDKEQFIAEMREDALRMLGLVAEAVNNAPSGNVISGSEKTVRDLVAEFRQRAFEKAVQMRIDSTESSFSPSEGRGGPSQAEQGAGVPDGAESQRADRASAQPVLRSRRRQSKSH
jgi:hypothetical protein